MKRSSPLPPSSAPLRSREPARGGPIRKRNTKRRMSEFARCFGSRERVAWIKSRACVVTGSRHEIENVHVRGGGAGRRADYCWIVPMSRPLHRLLHNIGKVSFECRWGIDLDYLAEQTQAAWQSHLRQTGRARQETE